MAHRTAPDAIPDALRNFDSLPNSANVRIPVAAGVLGCSTATVWRLIKRGKLRAKKQSERVTTINVGELRKAAS